jgi:nicotinic acid mononucleotide adenylyltransferase
MIRIREEIHQLLVAHLLEEKKDHLISKIEETLISDLFESEMLNLVEGKHFKTQDVFQLFYECFKIITNRFENFGELEDLEQYTYQYALKLSYPETEVEDYTKRKNKFATIALQILRIFFNLQKEHDSESWVSRYALEVLTEKEIAKLEDDEYTRFVDYLDKEYVYEMMKMNQDLIGYSTLDHICGVHHLAVKVGRQLDHLNIPIDLGRVSGAAYGHDIGKYGCKPDEGRKVAYYHYYYTAEWFTERDIVYIRNVAFNHSTWDLELANLSLESLVLIYCDFRVKANEDRSSKFPMRYYSLDDAFDVILSKLDNVDLAKEKRYRRVYNRLKDFEDFMIEKGINLDPDSSQDLLEGHILKRKHFSIMQGDQIIENAKFLSITHNIGIMNRLRDENSLNAMLENARGLDNIDSLRSYQYIIEEYSEYLTQKQKLIALNFLYERLMLPAEDIRKQTAKLIGLLIANFDEIQRKELPKGARKKIIEIDSRKLFENYLSKTLFPNLRIIDKHKEWIRHSMSSMVKSLLKHASKDNLNAYMKIFISTFNRKVVKTELAMYMLEAIRVLPFDRLKDEDTASIITFANNVAYTDDAILRVQAFDVLCEIIPDLSPSEVKQIRAFKPAENFNDLSAAEVYIRYKLLKLTGYDDDATNQYRLKCIAKVDGHSDVYLSNLKSATSWICKKLQIELLLRFVVKYKKEDSFYLSMHLCNLLKVSSHESVRNAAGKGLIELSEILSKGQINDIVIELLRALEMENYQYTKYICEYLGTLMTKLQLQELDEIIDSFSEQINRANPQICTLILLTTGVVIEHLPTEEYEKEDFLRIRRNLLSILLKGFVNYDTKVNQVAVNVIGKNIFDSRLLPIEDKAIIFKKMIKKILSLMVNTDETVELIYLNNAAGLNHIYNFISDYTFEKGEIELEINNKIAFFPGAFDPFSLSHKEIAKGIRDLGFEVYLSVDEFSWSKRTQPNLIRRDIMKMSIADEFDLYVFPRDISVNIANSKDLERLKKTYAPSDVYIVIGSDVILNASAYKRTVEEYSIHNFSHVIFERHAQIYSSVEKERLEKNVKGLARDVVRLVLPPQFEQISSTQIRNYIDEGRDISDLIDPLAQKYIYARGLYQREPQFKEMVTTKSVYVEVVNEMDYDLAAEIVNSSEDGNQPDLESLKKLIDTKKPRAIVLRSIKDENKIISYSIFHWLRSANVYEEFDDETVAEYILEHSVGRIITIDAMVVNKRYSFSDPEQMILTETLAFCLSKDYSYAVIEPIKGSKLSERFKSLLNLHGFLVINEKMNGNNTFVVEMSSPCTLNLDARTVLKEPLRSNKNVTEAINTARKELQRALTKLYPGNLVLSFDRTMLYENLIKKITDINGVPSIPTHPRSLGEAMCVPFGAVFKRWILPNTVTKSLHTERFFSPDVESYEIQAYPYYLDIINQVKRIKSFNRPVVLVDDLLNKGYRVKAIQPLMKNENIDVKKVLVGIMSGRGKAILENENIPVDSAYFIPRLKVWFNESLMYPFLGGDTLWRGVIPTRNIIPSINQILPYTSPNYIKSSSMKAIYDLSEVCIENAISILRVLEDEYQYLHENSLTLSHLGEVLVSPRFPDRGEKISYDMSQKSSDYLKNDLEQLRRLKKYIYKDA